MVANTKFELKILVYHVYIGNTEYLIQSEYLEHIAFYM